MSATLKQQHILQRVRTSNSRQAMADTGVYTAKNLHEALNIFVCIAWGRSPWGRSPHPAEEPRDTWVANGTHDSWLFIFLCSWRCFTCRGCTCATVFTPPQRRCRRAGDHFAAGQLAAAPRSTSGCERFSSRSCHSGSSDWISSQTVRFCNAAANCDCDGDKSSSTVEVEPSFSSPLLLASLPAQLRVPLLYFLCLSSSPSHIFFLKPSFISGWKITVSKINNHILVRRFFSLPLGDMDIESFLDRVDRKCWSISPMSV